MRWKRSYALSVPEMGPVDKLFMLFESNLMQAVALIAITDLIASGTITSPNLLDKFLKSMATEGKKVSFLETSGFDYFGREFVWPKLKQIAMTRRNISAINAKLSSPPLPPSPGR